jgi:hypothetical protein
MLPERAEHFSSPDRCSAGRSTPSGEKGVVHNNKLKTNGGYDMLLMLFWTYISMDTGVNYGLR